MPTRKSWKRFLVIGPVLPLIIAYIYRRSAPLITSRTYYDPDEASSAFARKVTHVWPTGRGHIGSYGWANSTAPFELSNKTLAWTWQHMRHKYFTLLYGAVMDSEYNIYLSGADAIRKFSPMGQILWVHQTLPHRSMDTPALYDGALYTGLTSGELVALNIETGFVIWKSKMSAGAAEDNGFVNAHDGVVVVDSDPNSEADLNFNKLVRGLNATDGTELWKFKPDVTVWNFMASFPGDGTLVFQDYEGTAYRLKLRTGELMWKAGGNRGSWTDGTMTLGPNNVVYAVACKLPQGQGGPFAPGDISAYRLSDGKLLWRVDTKYPPNVAPGVAKLYKRDKLSLVQAIGQQVNQNAPTEVVAYDAETGDFQWKFEGPRQKGQFQAGDLEGAQIRGAVLSRPMCLPNPWSAPTIDAAGTVYIGNQDGIFFALRDINGDGEVIGDDEVSGYDTGATFSGSAGPIVAPGMVVAVCCDTLLVFKEPTDQSV